MRPTGDAIAIAVLAALLLFVAANLQAGWVYAVDALLIALLAVGWLSARFSVRGLTVERLLPREVFEGDAVTVTLRVAARRGRRHFLELHDAVPGLTAHVSFLPYADARRKAEGIYRAIAKRRGVHCVDSVDVRSSGLAGLFEARRRVPVPGAVTVFPRYWPVPEFPLPGRVGVEAASVPQPARDGLDVAGVREFRDGDSLRHVHWRSTARRGTLVVREFERDVHQPVALLLDTRPPVGTGDGAAEAFEDLVRAAASIAHAVTRSGRAVQLAGASGADPLTVVTGWTQALHWLARTRADGALAPADVYAAAIPPGAPVVICSADADAVAVLAQHGIPVAAVLVDAASYARAFESTQSSQSTRSTDFPPRGVQAADRVDSGQMLLRALSVPVAVLRWGEEVGACLRSLRG